MALMDGVGLGRDASRFETTANMEAGERKKPQRERIFAFGVFT